VVAYREFQPIPELEGLAACTWEREVPVADGPAATRVLPDGCVDLVWRGSELIVAGPDREALMSPLQPGETVVGLRLPPGVAGATLGIPAKEVRDMRVSLRELWRHRGAELEERLGLAATPSQRRRLLEGALLARLPQAEEPDSLVVAAARVLGLPGARVDALSSALGTSERQLRRRFDDAVGYGPKTLDRILRFQCFLSLTPHLSRGDDGLSRAAAELGYSDQAHLSRECLRLSGLTPGRMVGDLFG
jgi:AraC-like DNA-binding protein